MTQKELISTYKLITLVNTYFGVRMETLFLEYSEGAESKNDVHFLFIFVTVFFLSTEISYFGKDLILPHFLYRVNSSFSDEKMKI